MAVAAAAITPAGVRDGERATLRALSMRRGTSVLSYCERVCAPGLALDAAADAFARFRATVVSSPQLEDIDPEAILLAATRHAAARRAPLPPASGWLGVRGPGSRTCPLVPELLAARADGELSSGDVERLDRHVRRCGQCREAEQRWRSAETAYRAASPDAPAEPAVEVIERALLAAAPASDARGTQSPDAAHAPLAAAPGSDARVGPSAGAAQASPTADPANLHEGDATHAAEDPRPVAGKVGHVPPIVVAEPPELPIALASPPRPAATSETKRTREDGPPQDHAVGDGRSPAAASLNSGGASPPAAGGDGGTVSSAAADSSVEPGRSLGSARRTQTGGHDPGATMAWALRPLEAHLLEDDLDATTAWALDAPDFHGEILATDLRVKDVSATSDVEPADVRPRRIRRALLPLAIGLVALVVALALVGTLANSDRHRTAAPQPTPAIAPPAPGNSSTAIPPTHRRATRRRRVLPRATSSATTPRPSAAAAQGPGPAPATQAPSVSRRAPTSPASSRKTAPASTPVTPPGKTTPPAKTPPATTPTQVAPGAPTPNAPVVTSPGGSATQGGTPGPAP